MLSPMLSIGSGDWSCSTWQCATPAVAAASMIGSIGMHAVAEFLERVVGQAAVVRELEALLEILQVELRDAALEFADQSDRIDPAGLDPEDVDLELHLRETVRR